MSATEHEGAAVDTKIRETLLGYNIPRHTHMHYYRAQASTPPYIHSTCDIVNEANQGEDIHVLYPLRFDVLTQPGLKAVRSKGRIARQPYTRSEYVMQVRQAWCLSCSLCSLKTNKDQRHVNHPRQIVWSYACQKGNQISGSGSCRMEYVTFTQL
jgi:hypothetical protein